MRDRCGLLPLGSKMTPQNRTMIFEYVNGKLEIAARGSGGQSTHKRRETNTLISGACNNGHILAWLESPPDEPNIPSARVATTSEFSADRREPVRISAGAGAAGAARRLCKCGVQHSKILKKPCEWFLQGRSSQDEAHDRCLLPNGTSTWEPLNACGRCTS